MKSLLSVLFGFMPSSYGGLLGNMMFLLFGMLVITGGRIGIQATSESEVNWIEVFSTLPLWFGWLMVWMAFDGIFAKGKATTFILSKTIVPVVRAALGNIIGEERLSALEKRFEKKGKVRDIPLTLVEVKDLKGVVVLTKRAYEQTAGSVFDYARQCGVEIKVEDESEHN